MQNKLFEKIELYLNHELTEEETKLFEQQLRNDEELREQLALYKNMDEEMRRKIADSDEEHKLKQTLSGLSEKYFVQGKREKVIRLRPQRRWLFAAAAVLLLIATGLYWYFLGSNKSSSSLYEKYVSYQPLSLQRDTKSTSGILQDAVTAYNAKKFDDALKGFNQWLQTDSSDAELILAQDICLMETGKYEQAIDGFDRLAGKNDIFKFQAIWYKALAYLKQNNKTECKKILETIPPGADNYKKAQALLKDL